MLGTEVVRRMNTHVLTQFVAIGITPKITYKIQEYYCCNLKCNVYYAEINESIGTVTLAPGSGGDSDDVALVRIIDGSVNQSSDN